MQNQNCSFVPFLILAHVHTSGFGDRLDRGVRRSLVTAEETCGQAAQGGVGRQVELFYQIDILGEDTHLYTGGHIYFYTREKMLIEHRDVLLGICGCLRRTQC